jgi:hypothetical protein
MDLDVTNDTTPCFEVSYKTKEILPCWVRIKIKYNMFC